MACAETSRYNTGALVGFVFLAGGRKLGKAATFRNGPLPNKAKDVSRRLRRRLLIELDRRLDVSALFQEDSLKHRE